MNKKKNNNNVNNSMYTFFVFTGSARATLGCASPTSGATKSQPHMRCAKTRPGLEKCLSIKVGRERQRSPRLPAFCPLLFLLVFAG